MGNAYWISSICSEDLFDEELRPQYLGITLELAARVSVGNDGELVTYDFLILTIYRVSDRAE